MSIVVVGLNHKTAPVDLLERLSISEERLGKALHQLATYEHVLEGAILSTCNRIEAYAVVSKFHGGAQDLRNFFAEIPHSLDEAAMIDGCTRISMLRKVMIPLMGPGILTAGIFLFLFAFQEYLTAAILTDTASKTVPVFITTQLGQTLPMLQQAGAAAMLLTLPVIGIAFIAQKYLIAGLASGAVKG